MRGPHELAKVKARRGCRVGGVNAPRDFHKRNSGSKCMNILKRLLDVMMYRSNTEIVWSDMDLIEEL
ncbi:hypothetical protein CapIbe_000576 [Capra ibex]